MENKNAQQEMDRLPLSVAVNKNIIPSVIVMLMTIIYNMADKVFVRMTGNDTMVAAVTLCAPVIMIFSAFGMIFATGGLAVISTYMGLGEQRKISGVTAYSFWSCIVIGVIGTVLVLLFRTPFASALGAADIETIRYTKDYLFWIAVGGPFIMATHTLSSLIRTFGKPNASMAGTIFGNLVNIVLDPVFILGMDMGTYGAALATMLGQAASVLFYLGYILSGKCEIDLRPSSVILQGTAGKVFAIGIPTALGSFCQSLTNILSNNLMGMFGAASVAALGAFQNIYTMVIALIVMGIGNGIQPLLGYQVGAGNRNKFERIFKYSMRIVLIFCCAMLAVCLIFAHPLAGIFVAGSETTALAARFIRIGTLAVWAYGIVTAISSVIPTTGKGGLSLIVTLSRNGYVFAAALLVMNALCGRDDILWANVVSDVICLFITVFTFKKAVDSAFSGHTPKGSKKEVSSKNE